MSIEHTLRPSLEEVSEHGPLGGFYCNRAAEGRCGEGVSWQKLKLTFLETKTHLPSKNLAPGALSQFLGPKVKNSAKHVFWVPLTQKSCDIMHFLKSPYFLAFSPTPINISCSNLCIIHCTLILIFSLFHMMTM